MDDGLRDWISGQMHVVKVTEHRSRPWADIWRVEAVEGVWWLKQNKAGTVHEPALLRLLGGLGFDLVPPAISHPRQPWSLIADAGRPARERLRQLDRGAVVRFWCELLAEYADLQRRTPVEDLLSAGLADFRPERLPERYAELLEQTGWFEAPAIDLDPTTRERVAALGPQIAGVSAELAAGVAGTVQHDDLHEDNVLLIDGDLGRARIIDWGDAALAHPFGTLRLSLDTLRETFAEDFGVEEFGSDMDADLDAITSAYLEGWRTGGVGERELRRQVRLARWLECVSRSACWIRALGSLEVGLAEGLASAPARWLQMMADEADELRIDRA